MREVSRHLFIPRRPLIASMLSSDPERSWIRIVKGSLISSTRPALISADLAARNIDHKLSGLAEIPEYLTKEIIREFWGFTPCRFGIIIAPSRSTPPPMS